MSNWKANLWLFGKKTKDVTFSYEVKQKARFVKGSVIAIICGLVIAGIIIAAENVNPFMYLKYLFDIGFSHRGGFVDQTLQWLCIYIVVGLAVGIGFKSGMFNIGVSGQMVLSSGIAIIFYKMVVEPKIDAGTATFNAGYIIAIFIICSCSGALWSGIAGALKALFNIHEVVTTIMLNWTAWYLMKYLFTKFSTTIGGHGVAASGSIPGESLTINGSTIAIPIIIAGFAVIIVAVILAKTVFGYKLKAVGASPSASKYAGFSVKEKMIDAMLMSGFLAGIGAFINIFTIAPNLTFASDNLPQTGYDAIAITLVAFNNPLGIVFSSFLWAVLQSSGSGVASLYGLPTQIAQLVFGVIIYFAAVSVIFINWYPVIKLRIMIALTGNKSAKLQIKNLRKEQLQYSKELMNINKSKDIQEYKAYITEQINEQKVLLKAEGISPLQVSEIKNKIRNLKLDMNLYVKEQRKAVKEMIKKISKQIRILKKNNYVNRINSAREGIDRRQWDAVRACEQKALSEVALIKSNLLSDRDDLKKELNDKNHWLSIKLKELRKQYKLKLKQNAVWFESETGIKNHYWEMRNGRIEAKALINKNKIETHNEILNIKSNHQLDVADLRAQYKNHPIELAKLEQKSLGQMQLKINELKLKSEQFINEQISHVKELEITYETTKAANEAEQKEILKNKEIVEQKNREIAEILDVWDNNLATLVDIKLAYELKNKYVREWYAEQKQQIIQTNNDVLNLARPEESQAKYNKVMDLVNAFKQYVEKLGTDNDWEIIKAKEKELKKLKASIKKIWVRNFSPYDNAQWSKARYNIYIWLMKEQVKLDKLQAVIEADDQINEIRNKGKLIRKMYGQNIKTYKSQYQTNKKVNPVKAQQAYSVAIEKFISKLEKSSFEKLKELETKEVR